MPSPQRSLRALLYARVSHDVSGRGRSVDEQVAECQAWADREGWDVFQVVEETGSASRYARRPRERWEDVVTAVESGACDVLLTWESSRATRDLAVYAMLRDLCARHSVLWGYSGTLYDLSRREDRFRTGLDALTSEDEAARTSERVRRASRARAAAGRPHARAPYGYTQQRDARTGQLVDFAPHPEQAPVLRSVFADVAAGVPLYAIAKRLRDDDVPTPRPTKYGWQGATLYRFIRNPAYRAQRVHRGQVVGPATWPALVTDELWDAANARLDDPARPARPDTTARHLLSGIARCGVCGGPLYVVRPRGYATYTCKPGGCVARSQRLLEQFVVDRVLALLTTRADITRPPGDDTDDVAAAAAELEALRARLDAFTTAAADGDLSPAALAKVEKRLAPQITAAEARLRALRLPAALAGVDLSDPAALWDGADVDQRRTLLRQLVEVTVHRAHRGRRVIDPTTVDVIPVW